MNPTEQINSILTQAAQPALTVKHLVCKLCGSITMHDMAKAVPPSTCPHCQQTVSFVVMPTPEKAAEIAEIMKWHLSPVSAGAAGVAPTQSAIVHSTVPLPEKLPVTKAPEQPINSMQAALPPFVAAATVMPTPAAKVPRTRKPAAPKPESAPVTEAPAQTAATAVQPTPSTGTVNAGAAGALAEAYAATGEALDFRAMREAATNLLIQKHGLNEAEVREVSHGTIFTLGFTQWIEDDEGKRKPVYSFKELTDTPQSFKAELNGARQGIGGGLISIDVARVIVPVPEVAASTFGSELIASLKSQHGPVMAAAGAKVRLGAKVGRTGRLIWFVLGISK